jgi:hypothetical protein
MWKLKRHNGEGVERAKTENMSFDRCNVHCLSQFPKSVFLRFLISIDLLVAYTHNLESRFIFEPKLLLQIVGKQALGVA